MSSRYYTKDQEYNKEFLAIVDAFGGKNCTSWTQVARKYEQTTGQKVAKANTLRYRWEQLTNYSENFTVDQKTLLYECDIKARGLKQQARRDFYKQTGVMLYQGRFCRISSTHLKQAIQYIDEVFARERKHRRCGKKDSEFKVKLSHLSIYILLRARDILTSSYFKDENSGISDFDQFLCKDLLEMSSLCERLFLLHAKIFHLDRDIRYERYIQILTRYKYRKLMFYIEYLDILRKISLEQTNHNFFSHPLVSRNLALNKESLIYKTLIQECDWQQKYQWYNECALTQLEEEDFSLLLKQQNKNRRRRIDKSCPEKHQVADLDNQNNLETIQRIQLQNLEFDFVPKHCNRIYNKNNQAKIVNKTQKEYRKFRGHFIKPGDTRTDTRYTKIFTCEEDSEYDEDQNEVEAGIEAKTRIEKLQNLFHEAFVAVPNKKKQRNNIQDPESQQ